MSMSAQPHCGVSKFPTSSQLAGEIVFAQPVDETIEEFEESEENYPDTKNVSVANASQNGESIESIKVAP